MKRLYIGWLILVMSLLFGLQNPAHGQEGPNLLRNGDFEEGGPGQAWPFQDGIPEVQVAPGWRAFYLDNPPPYVVAPDYCQGDVRCAWGRPEFRGVASYEFAYRVRSGQLAQKYFSWNRQHEAGLYQQVGGIQPRTHLRFSVWIHTWSCMPATGTWSECRTTPLSDNPAPMHIWVGIDPTGGTDWSAPTVVRSPEGNAYDQWTLFQVEATAQSSTVTVFIHTRADWTDRIPRINNDVYIDDASLVAIGQATPTPLPPPPTSPPGTTGGSSFVLAVQPTPRPDGCRVHIVRLGDTLFGIALQYGIPMENLERLNAGSLGPNKMIWPGQEIVLSCPEATPTPEPTPTPEATPTPESGQVCVLAFHDRNGDGVRQQETEELLPNVLFLLKSAVGLIGQYTTDSLNEPYCFPDLMPGTYWITVQPMPGYKVTGPAEMALSLAGGELQAAFALQRGETAAVTPAIPLPGQTPVPATHPTGIWPQVLRWGARIGGIMLIALAMATAVLFVLSRPRM